MAHYKKGCGGRRKKKREHRKAGTCGRAKRMASRRQKNKSAGRGRWGANRSSGYGAR